LPLVEDSYNNRTKRTVHDRGVQTDVCVLAQIILIQPVLLKEMMYGINGDITLKPFVPERASRGVELLLPHTISNPDGDAFKGMRSRKNQEGRVVETLELRKSYSVKGE